MASRARRPAYLLSALVSALVVAACAVGGPAPPAETASEDAAPPDLSAAHVAGADGTALALSHWPAGSPEAVILGVHGFGDYGPSTFGRAADFWRAQGIEVYAYDQRGFGRNPSFGRWPGAEALAADLRAVAAEIRARHPCLPLVVVGHSMGGGVALVAAGAGLDADGLVLAAPAIWGGAEMNPAYRLLAWSAAAVVPERRFSGEGVVRIQATDNLETLRALAQDPRYLSPPSARELFGLVRLADRAAAAAERVTLPALLLLGEKDQIAPNARVRRVFARLAGPRREIVYAAGWHLLFRDLQAARVWRDVAEWALSAVPAPSGCEAG